MSSLISGSNAQDFRARSSSLTRAPNPYIFNGIARPFYGEVYYFDPSQMAGIVAWFDPGQGITLDGSGNVSQWVDRIKPWTATQSTTTKRLAFVPHGLNGFPGLFGNKTNATNMTVTSLSSVTLPRTVVHVTKDYQPGSDNNTIIGSVSAGGLQIRTTSSGGVNYLKENQIDLGRVEGLFTPNTFVIVAATYDASNNYIIRVNGGSSNTGTFFATTLSGGGDVTLFDDPVSIPPGPEAAVGPVGDTILTGIVSSTADMQKAEGYLAWKYNLTSLLPSTHPYKNIPVVGSAAVQMPTWAPAYKRM